MKLLNKKIVTGTVAATLVLGGGLVGILHNQVYAAVTGTAVNTSVTTADSQNDQETADDAASQNKESNDLSQADLQKQAKITKEQSAAIAAAQVKGTVKDVQLEDENGAAVYNVQIQDNNDRITEVKVDAAAGKITKQEQADNKQEGQDQESNDDQQQ